LKKKLDSRLIMGDITPVRDKLTTEPGRQNPTSSSVSDCSSNNAIPRKAPPATSPEGRSGSVVKRFRVTYHWPGMSSDSHFDISEKNLTEAQAAAQQWAGVIKGTRGLRPEILSVKLLEN
jgi:hypothetical protein